MSTRSLIKLQDAGGGDTVYFYHHSDGYPSHMLPLLRQFMEKVWAGRIRNNAMQAGGWLVILGVACEIEARTLSGEYESIGGMSLRDYWNLGQPGISMNWKASPFEPAPDWSPIPWDIEYIYTITLGAGANILQVSVPREKGKPRPLGKPLTLDNWPMVADAIIAKAEPYRTERMAA